MIANPYDVESECLESMEYPLLLRVMLEFHSDDNLGKSRVDDLVIGKSVFAKGLDVEPDRGGDVGNRFLIRIAFANDNAFHADRVCDVAVRVFLDNDLEGLH